MGCQKSGQMRSSFGPKKVHMIENKTRFELSFGDGNSESFETNLIGVHNILNLSSVIHFALLKGYSVDQIKESIENLNLVKRRQEYKGKINGGYFGECLCRYDLSFDRLTKGPCLWIKRKLFA